MFIWFQAAIYGAGCWAYNQRPGKSGVGTVTSGKFYLMLLILNLIFTWSNCSYTTYQCKNLYMFMVMKLLFHVKIR